MFTWVPLLDTGWSGGPGKEAEGGRTRRLLLNFQRTVAVLVPSPPEWSGSAHEAGERLDFVTVFVLCSPPGYMLLVMPLNISGEKPGVNALHLEF